MQFSLPVQDQESMLFGEDMEICENPFLVVKKENFFFLGLDFWDVPVKNGFSIFFLEFSVGDCHAEDLFFGYPPLNGWPKIYKKIDLLIIPINNLRYSFNLPNLSPFCNILRLLMM